MNGTTLRLPFGYSKISVQVPTHSLLGVFTPRENVGAFDETTILREALAHPIGTPCLRDLAQPRQEVVIVTSDLTRPCPSERLLPLVLNELAAAGIPDQNVTIVVALGLHRPMTTSELETAVGSDVYRRVQVINHNPADTVRLGVTSVGTPVEFFRTVVEADLRVCLGNLEFHYFAGYTGGAKAILPGCASKATINANHAMMTSPKAVAGRLEENPVRIDLEEGTAMLGVDFILNVLVDGNNRVVGAVAGEVTAAHRQGCKMVAQRGKVQIPSRADIVVVSAGGTPTDINLYQAQKALDNASYAVREGGIIILVAECSEGFGNQIFETWMREARSPKELLGRFQRGFILGGHKAAAIALVLEKAEIYLVSSYIREVFLKGTIISFNNLEEAMRAAFKELGHESNVIVLPHGESILPFVK